MADLVTLAADWLTAKSELATAVTAANSANGTVATKRAALNSVEQSILTEMNVEEKQLVIVNTSGTVGVVMQSNGSSVNVSTTTIESAP